MILHAIELSHVGPFRDTVRLGPFTRGLNLLCAPNEAGKSTAMRAAARALFDRHTTRSEELKAFQPAGTDLAPGVAVEFETRAGRFRIEKTFLLSPSSVLKQWLSGGWQAVAEADAADQRVQALLSSTLPGRGATKPEHWGFLGFLWARQGEPTEWPGLDDAAVGQGIRARLARVELDPVIEQLRARLAAATGEILTSTGLPKANGPLDRAEKEIAGLEAELAALRHTRADLDGAQQGYARASGDVVNLESEYARRASAAATAREQGIVVEQLRVDLEARTLALAGAQEKLNTVAADAGMLTKHREDSIATTAALEQAELVRNAAAVRLAELRRQMEEQHAARPQLEGRLAALRAEQERVQALVRLHQWAATAGVLVRRVARAEAAATEVATLEARRAGLSTLTAAKLRRLEELAESVRTWRAQVQALGLTVELTPAHDTTVLRDDGASPTPARLDLSAHTPTRLHSPQSLDLQLGGWGRVVIRSGAQEAHNAASRLAESDAALREALDEAGSVSVEAAREAFAARQELDALLKAARATLDMLLGEENSLAALREETAQVTRRLETSRAVLLPTEEELARSLTELETADARLAEAVSAAEKALKLAGKQLDHQRGEERDAAKALQDATQVAGEHRARLRILETQMADIANRYAEGIDTARHAAQIGFVQAEARVAARRAELPPDFEKLPERHRRAAVALQQITDELQARRAERDQARGTLETLGGQGLYSRETELEERRAEALLRRDAARTLGWSARIAHDLIERRKQAATKAVLKPLEQRLTTAFAGLTGECTREVFLDEHLQIAGIGRTRDAVYAFDHLSQGAKEQLLLCLRLAVAQELATDEPQVLILDDVLVNTDALRQERILDVLGAVSSTLQIVVLTCHADRYRGVGQPITMAG